MQRKKIKIWLITKINMISMVMTKTDILKMDMIKMVKKIEILYLFGSHYEKTNNTFYPTKTQSICR